MPKVTIVSREENVQVKFDVINTDNTKDCVAYDAVLEDGVHVMVVIYHGELWLIDDQDYLVEKL